MSIPWLRSPLARPAQPTAVSPSVTAPGAPNTSSPTGPATTPVVSSDGFDGDGDATALPTRTPAAGAHTVVSARIDLPDPPPVSGSSKPVPVAGVLWGKEGPRLSDVRQGSLADCFLCGGIGGVVAARPELIKKMFKDHGDGTYTVRLQIYDWDKEKYRNKSVRIDSDIYGGTSPNYAQFGQSEDGKPVLWFALLEKAYAMVLGSYGKLHDGGSPAEALELPVNQIATEIDMSKPDEKAIETALLKIGKEKLPAVCATADNAALYSNTGLYPCHTYSIIGCEEHDGKVYAVCRNPWGSSPGRDPIGRLDDGKFRIDVPTFAKLFDTFAYCER